MPAEGSSSPEIIGVVGAGQMGAGIAFVAAAAGYDVILSDINDGILARASESIEQDLVRQIRRGLIHPEEKDEILDRIRMTTYLEDHQKSHLVIESAREDFSIKAAILKELDLLCPSDTIFACNTSSLSIARLGAETGRPDRVVGMHFMLPVPVMELVEIIYGLETSEQTRHVVADLARDFRKTPVECRDFPGFVSNRLLIPMINEAIFAVYEGVASIEAVDEIMQLGMNHPMGPLRLADLIGLDTCLTVMRVLYQGMGDPKYRPCPLLVKMVEAGRLGRKSGRGFYSYTAE